MRNSHPVPSYLPLRLSSRQMQPRDRDSLLPSASTCGMGFYTGYCTDEKLGPLSPLPQFRRQRCPGEKDKLTRPEATALPHKTLSSFRDKCDISTHGSRAMAQQFSPGRKRQALKQGAVSSQRNQLYLQRSVEKIQAQSIQENSEGWGDSQL